MKTNKSLPCQRLLIVTRRELPEAVVTTPQQVELATAAQSIGRDEEKAGVNRSRVYIDKYKTASPQVVMGASGSTRAEPTTQLVVIGWISSGFPLAVPGVTCSQWEGWGWVCVCYERQSCSKLSLYCFLTHFLRRQRPLSAL